MHGLQCSRAPIGNTNAKNYQDFILKRIARCQLKNSTWHRYLLERKSFDFTASGSLRQTDEYSPTRSSL